MDVNKKEDGFQIGVWNDISAARSVHVTHPVFRNLVPSRRNAYCSVDVKPDFHRSILSLDSHRAGLGVLPENGLLFSAGHGRPAIRNLRQDVLGRETGVAGFCLSGSRGAPARTGVQGARPLAPLGLGTAMIL